MNRYAIVLAAGKGTRMKSDLVKPMHKIIDKPMIEYIVDNLTKANSQKIVTIVGYNADTIKKYLGNKCEYAIQEILNGTGAAVSYAKQLEGLEGYTLVVNGDAPLIQPETFDMMYREVEGYGMAILSAHLDDPKANGRIIRDEKGKFSKIVEYKDCNDNERKINEVCVGIYAFDNKLLFKYLGLLNNNNKQNEYYITDLAKIFKDNNHQVKIVQIPDAKESMGVNDRNELSLATKWLVNKINTKHMLNGVTIINPDVTYISDDVIIEEDNVIYPNTYITGKTKIGKRNIIIGTNIIHNTIIGNDNLIKNAEIVNSTIGNNNEIGPYIQIDGCHIESYEVFKNMKEDK